MFVLGSGRTRMNADWMRKYDEELRQMLQTAEFTPLHQYGIRALCDFIADNDLKYDPDFYETLETLELALRDREPYKFLACFYHFIAQWNL